jgi:hypothetical protein
MFFTILSKLLSDPNVQLAFMLPVLVLIPEVILGALVAARQGTFANKYLADFFSSHVLPYLGAVVMAFATAVTTKQGYAGAVLSIAAFVAVWVWSQVNSIADNLGVLLGTGGGGLVTLIRVLIETFFHKSPPTTPPSGSAPAVASLGTILGATSGSTTTTTLTTPALAS